MELLQHARQHSGDEAVKETHVVPALPELLVLGVVGVHGGDRDR